MSNDFKTILNRLLSNVDDSLDKRQGSIIYDALAPAALELAQCYAELDIYYEQTYLKTATGENLDNRVADYGLTRNPATQAIRIIEIYNNSNQLYDIPIESRFSIPAENGGYTYETIEKISTGKFKARCDTAGSVGNEYVGVLLPLYNITGLGKAEIIGTFQAGEDTEDDESLRKRAIAKLNTEPFGGNQADYKRYIDTIPGIGGAKIFPIWDGGGTVKISFVNSDYTIPSAEFISEVQTLIDPIANHGEGLGLAPIGHTVTVVAPTDLDIDVTANIELVDGYTINQIQDAVEEAIGNYITEVQINWENSSTLKIYISRVVVAILSVEGVSNVTNITLNSSSSDLTLTETATTQQFPYLGEVTLSES